MVVSTTSPTNNGPAHDNEKRRKQTVERAKANHMRLQYARLKVDHGWQKQNLNEVENLYFHHSHLRGPKPSPTMMTATLNEPSTTYPSITSPSSNTSQSSLSFKLGPSSLSRGHTSGSSSPSHADNVPPDSSAPQAISSHDPSLPLQSAPAAVVNPSELKSLIEMEAELENKPLQEPPIITSSYAPPPPAGPSHTPTYGAMSLTTPGSNYRSDHSLAPTPISTTWATTAPRVPPPLPSPNHYPNIPLQRQPTLPVSPGMGENQYNFPGVSLTYDSFWSSHSSTTTASARSFRSPTGSIAPSAVSGMGSTSGLNDAYMSRTYQAEPASAHGRQNIGARATAGRE
ncbi:hypothetical protein DXG01_011553 [Tephrocybe rancida]|nr:hypothetical protein DXG01_011553 [Tephrocybe rancida]